MIPFLPLILVAGVVTVIVKSKKNEDTSINGVPPILLKFPKGTTKAQKELILSWAQGNDKATLNGAYYKRNNSYSRSYNASQAEQEGRFPLTRAAQYIGLTRAAFLKGAEHADLKTTEWHHVGKYANKVDYWDVSSNSEIYNSYKFWFGAMNKSNKDWCMENLIRIARKMLNQNMKPKSNKLSSKGYEITKVGNFNYRLTIHDLSKKDKIMNAVKKEFKHRYHYNKIEISPSGSEKGFFINVPVDGRIWQECQASIKAGRGSSNWSKEYEKLMFNQLGESNNKFKLFIDWGTNNPKLVDKAESLKELYSIYLNKKSS